MKTKRIITITSLSLVGFLALGGGLSALFCYAIHYHGKEIIQNWSETDVFNINSIKTIQKESGKDFKILNLADIQIWDFDSHKIKKNIHDEISYLVDITKPDLITLTGDQVMFNENLMSMKHIISWLDSYKIPYAPVFGNHDSGNDYDSAVADTLKMCEMYEKGKYSLFSRGPSNLGSYGNYVININEGNKIIRSLYFVDSGVKDTISDQQISWLKWISDSIKDIYGTYQESFAFMHMPIPEFEQAYLEAVKNKSTNNVFVTFALYGSKQNGFFEAIKTRNFTNIICGHQHGNNFTLPYEGINLTFAVKTGKTCSYYTGNDVTLNGATLIKINQSTTIEHIHLDNSLF